MQYTEAEKSKISIDYQRAVRNCNDRAWEQMTAQEKLSDMQSVENYNAMQQGRIPAEVTMEQMDEGSYGYQNGNSIVHNESVINSTDYKESVDTNYHEGLHVYVEMSEMFPEVEQNFSQEFGTEVESIRSPIPDSTMDYEGYYNHPQERLAREAGERGVEQMEYDKSVIQEVDAMQPTHNQIVETYDYDALSMSQEQTGWENISVYSPDGNGGWELDGGESIGESDSDAGADIGDSSDSSDLSIGSD